MWERILYDLWHDTTVQIFLHLILAIVVWELTRALLRKLFPNWKGVRHYWKNKK